MNTDNNHEQEYCEKREQYIKSYGKTEPCGCDFCVKLDEEIFEKRGE